MNALPDQTTGTSEPEPLAVARRPVPHDSAIKQVQGGAPYIDDIREPAGTLHVAPGYARSAAKGKILSVDLAAVRAFPGVVAVLTAADIPGKNECSPSIGGDPVFAEGEILFHGQVVYAVVAETRDAARKAARLGHVEVAAEPPAVDVEAAIARNAMVLPDYEFVKGDPAAAIAAAPARLSGSIRVGGQEHFYLEGQAALAVPMEDGDLLVHTSTQHPTEVQHLVAKVLAIPDAAVVAECRRMGGGFGGKESQATQWAVIAALAARVTGKPAKLRLDRDDDMIMTGKRHDMRVDWTVAYDGDGRIDGVDVAFLARCGYSADLSLGVVDRTMFHADNAYDYPAAHILSRRLKTDTVSNTAFRGFGGPQGIVFCERMIDALAITLGRDPLDVRKANFYSSAGGTTPYGMAVTDNIIHELVDELETTSDYRARRRAIGDFNATSRVLKKGLALTPLKFGISFTLAHLNQAGALVHVYSDGSIMVNHGGTEMGQGLYIKVAQVVAEEFGVGIDKVKITATTTAKVPNTSPTAASSGSDLNGMAAKVAVDKIRGRMAEVAAAHFAVPVADTRFADGRVFGGNRSIGFEELAKKCYLARVQLSDTGYYATPGITWNRELKTGNPFFYFAYGAACSEVTIDTLTGELRVDRVDILHDCGASLNPAIDIGQIEGGFVQGMGWLTTEELVFDAGGRLATHAPSTYKIPTATDVPADFRVKLYSSGGNRADTIYRSKAVGEPPLMLAVSVFSAVTDAVASLKPGVVPPLDAPATPEAIMRAVKAMKGK
ncbi:MAG: xanthine dehydrogenase molybdopterin binding subunit [Ancalomicrobiaceae bacterium]|nr:xanthine dehydrogenase molybdopterin binding subunit [Ancalomicrobiaceae bacterium]